MGSVSPISSDNVRCISDVERLFAASVLSSDNRPALCTAVHAFTDDAKTRGEPVERVIVALKHAISRSRASARHLRLVSESLLVTDDLVTASVRWCIERYFEDTE